MTSRTPSPSSDFAEAHRTLMSISYAIALEVVAGGSPNTRTLARFNVAQARYDDVVQKIEAAA